MAALLDAPKVSALMRAIAAYEGQPLTRAALELSARLFQRPGNIRQMERAELDLEVDLWTILAAKMKRNLHGSSMGVRTWCHWLGVRSLYCVSWVH